jgi:hypothetical protein
MVVAGASGKRIVQGSWVLRAMIEITMLAGIVGRFLTGASNTGLLGFLCFLPMCFFRVGVMLKELREVKCRLAKALAGVRKQWIPWKRLSVTIGIRGSQRCRLAI